MRRLPAYIALAAGLLVGIHGSAAWPEPEAVGSRPRPDGQHHLMSRDSDPRDVPEALRKQPPNFLQVAENVYMGGEPSTERAFARLAKLGIRTVVSVDGALPNVQAAARHGLRYVHIPVGYDGINRHATLSLAQLARSAKSPFYVHCHHGRHRGPAAAAILCMESGATDKPSALDILHRAGTSKKYAGLWRDVAAYQCPPQGADLPELVSSAKVDSIAASMALIDRATENLRLCSSANWIAPPEHPDIEVQHESLLLQEGFREALRELDNSQEYEAPLVAIMKTAAHTADQLDQAMRAGNSARAGTLWMSLQDRCAECHQAYRN